TSQILPCMIFPWFLSRSSANGTSRSFQLNCLYWSSSGLVRPAWARKPMRAGPELISTTSGPAPDLSAVGTVPSSTVPVFVIVSTVMPVFALKPSKTLLQKASLPPPRISLSVPPGAPAPAGFAAAGVPWAAVVAPAAGVAATAGAVVGAAVAAAAGAGVAAAAGLVGTAGGSAAVGVGTAPGPTQAASTAPTPVDPTTARNRRRDVVFLDRSCMCFQCSFFIGRMGQLTHGRSTDG